MPGCMGLAEALIKGTCTVERCVVIQEDERKEIADILGVEAKTKVKTVAVLHCNGGSKRVKDKFIYTGPRIASRQIWPRWPKRMFLRLYRLWQL